MVELRPNISGFYKGLIYCSGLDEANAVSKYLDVILQQSIRPNMHSQIKRGCSEYPLSFPLYKEINMLGPQPMNFDSEWKEIEVEHDKKFSVKPQYNLKPTLRGLSLLDCKIMQNWFGYAKGLSDKSLDLIDGNINFNQKFFELGSERVGRHYQKT